MKYWKKLVMLMMVGVLAAYMLMGCSGQSSASDEKFRIGYVNLTETDVFCSTRKEAVKKALENDGGYSISFSDGNNDVQKQIDQVNAFIAQGIDAVILIPTDAAGAVPAVKACNEHNVPCILIGNACDPAECDYTFIGSPHYSSGYMEGEYIGRLLDESVGIENAKILYLEGTNGLDHAALRKQGTMEALEEQGFDWNSQCLDSQDADYVKADAMEITDAWIQKYGTGGKVEFQAVIAANDQMALGAMESLKGAGLLSDQTEIFIAGIDGTADALQAIVDGGMVQSVLQNAAGQGEASLDVLNQFLREGKTYDQIGTQSESYPGINEVMVDYLSITKENVNEYME